MESRKVPKSQPTDDIKKKEKNKNKHNCAFLTFVLLRFYSFLVFFVFTFILVPLSSGGKREAEKDKLSGTIGYGSRKGLSTGEIIYRNAFGRPTSKQTIDEYRALSGKASTYTKVRYKVSHVPSTQEKETRNTKPRGIAIV